VQESKLQGRSSKAASMSKLSSTRCQVEQAMDYELHTRCRNTEISRQPEEIQDIRIEEGME
jgi:hypothetical protein